MMGDKRGGFMVLELDKAEDLYELFGGLLDIGRLETHPVVSFKELGEFFKNNPVE